MTDSASRIDVLVVGAGPTGLALATTLRQAGIAPLVVDKLATGTNTSRAAVIHAHTLEILGELGVSRRLEREGLRLTRFSIRDRDRVLARLRFDRLPSAHACLLMLPQDRTEAILADQLARANGSVRWGTTVERLVQTTQGVEATLAAAGTRSSVLARYVVGADGMHSVVRAAAGIGFSGETYGESFLLADVEMQWGPGSEEVMLFFSPSGLLVVAPLPGGAYRIVATLDAAPAASDAALVQSLLHSRGPARQRSSVARVLWSSRFRIHHRVADAYRRGPYFLVGDAAHVHSPAGGQGMNTGLVDACLLGRLLADVLSGRRDASDLTHYEALRRPAAVEVLSLAGRLTGMATMKHPLRRLVRNAVLRLVDAVPAARRRLEMGLSGLSRRAAAQLPAKR